MANKKFSEFELKTTTSNVSHIVGYNGAENVRITPANFLDTTGGPYLPLAGGTMVGNTIHNDNIKSIYGTASDGLKIYHSGSNSIIEDTGTGILNIKSSNQIKLRTVSNEDYLVATETGSVDLYYDNSKKFETTSVGISVTGDGVFTDTLDVQGVDSITIADYILHSGDNSKFGFPSDDNFKIRLAGSDVLNIESSGNLGLGVSNPDAFTSVSAQNLVLGNLTTSNGITVLSSFSAFGNLAFADGTGVNDQYKGLIQYGHTLNSMQFFTNNLERLRIDSSGNLGVGTSTPDAKLQVFGTSAVPSVSGTFQGSLFSIEGSSTVSLGMGTSGSPGFYSWIQPHDAGGGVNYNLILNPLGGNVGLGTSSPTEKLTVESGAGFIATFKSLTATDFRPIRFQNAAGSDVGYLGNNDSTDEFSLIANNQPLVFGSGAGGFEKMRLDNSGRLGIGTTNPSRDGLNVFHTTTPYVHLTNTTTGDTSSDGGYLALAGTELRLGNQEASGDLNMFVDNDSTVGIIIKSGGNVGIGTSSPDHILCIEDTAPTFRIFDTDNTLNQEQSISFGTEPGDRIHSEISGINLNTGNSAGGLSFKTNGGTTLSEKMRIDSAGNVNIKQGQLDIQSQGNVAEINIIKIGTHPNNGYGSQISASSFYNSILSTDLRFSTTNSSGTTSEAMRLDASGNLLIGTTGVPNGTSVYGSAFTGSTNQRMVLEMASTTTAAATLLAFYNPNGLVGRIRTTGSATSYLTSSDYRLKEDLQDFKGLDLVSKIPVYDYKWKADESRSYGVIAHELEEVLPQAVSGEKDAEEMQSVDYSKIVPLLVKSIQELKAEIELLKNK